MSNCPQKTARPEVFDPPSQRLFSRHVTLNGPLEHLGSGPAILRPRASRRPSTLKRLMRSFRADRCRTHVRLVPSTSGGLIPDVGILSQVVQMHCDRWMVLDPREEYGAQSASSCQHPARPETSFERVTICKFGFMASFCVKGFVRILLTLLGYASLDTY